MTSEYEQKFNVKKDIQRLVETPKLYLMADVLIMTSSWDIGTRVSHLKEIFSW